MITVRYMPADSGHIGDGDKVKKFKTADPFYQWVINYVCDACLRDFRDWNETDPITVGDYLSMGCGCEVDIEDPGNQINWDKKISHMRRK